MAQILKIGDILEMFTVKIHSVFITLMAIVASCAVKPDGTKIILTAENRLKLCDNVLYGAVEKDLVLKIDKSEAWPRTLYDYPKLSVTCDDSLYHILSVFHREGSDTSCGNSASVQKGQEFRLSTGRIFEDWQPLDSVTFRCVLEIEHACFKNEQDSIVIHHVIVWRDFVEYKEDYPDSLIRQLDKPIDAVFY
jgi:hypothetical protein